MSLHGGPASDISFLTVDDVIELHSDVIDATSPGEPKDVLDAGRLEAATMAPQQTFGGSYLYETIFDMAAAYLVGLAAGHTFRQGNKRIALVAAGAFLKMNGINLAMTNDEAYDLTMDVVLHTIDRNDVANFFRTHAVFS